MRALAQQVDVAERLQPGDVDLRRPDEHDARLRHARGDARNQILIDPLVDAADVADHWPRQPRHIVRRSARALARGTERLQADARRQQVHPVVVARRPFPEFL